MRKKAFWGVFVFVTAAVICSSVAMTRSQAPMTFSEVERTNHFVDNAIFVFNAPGGLDASVVALLSGRVHNMNSLRFLIPPGTWTFYIGMAYWIIWPPRKRVVDERNAAVFKKAAQ